MQHFKRTTPDIWAVKPCSSIVPWGWHQNAKSRSKYVKYVITGTLTVWNIDSVMLEKNLTNDVQSGFSSQASILICVLPSLPILWSSPSLWILVSTYVIFECSIKNQMWTGKWCDITKLYLWCTFYHIIWFTSFIFIKLSSFFLLLIFAVCMTG